MKIFVDLFTLQHYPGGIPFYVIQLYQALQKIAPDLKLSSGLNTIRYGNFRKFSEAITEHIGCDVNLHWHPFPGRFSINRLPVLRRLLTFDATKYDVVHFPSHVCGDWVPFNRLHNAVLTVHDMYVFYQDKYLAHCSDLWRSFVLSKLPTQAAECAHILTVSEFSKREILKFLGDRVPPEKITVTYPSVQWPLAEMQQATPFPPNCCSTLNLKRGGYFLSVGAILKHKNFETLLAAWKLHQTSHARRPGTKLVIVGAGADPEITAHIQSTPDVIHLQNIPKGELLSLYKNALGFFLLSRIEGFGIPLLEAMLCGCPACYATGSSMDEIGGEEAWPIDADDVEGASALFERFQDDTEAVSRKASLARQIVETKFSWQKTARKTWEVFQKVGGKQHVSP